MENVETAALQGQETKLQALEAAGAATEVPVRPLKKNKKTKKNHHFTAEAQSTNQIQHLKINKTEPVRNNLGTMRHWPPRKVAVSSPSGRVIASWPLFQPVAV